MKRLTILAVALVLAACSSNNGMYSSAESGVSLKLAQVGSAADTFYFRGPVNVQYQLTIENPTDDTIKLRRLDLQTIGPGAYTLRTGMTPISATVAPHSTATIPLSAWARSAGGFLRSTEPVTVRGIADFESPHGSFRSQFNEIISQ